HLSLFINKGGGKLSKRDGAKSVLDYLHEGYLPNAVTNFIAFLGWNPKSEKEIFSIEELIEEFELKNVHTANPVFDTDKLDWYNGQYIRNLNPEQLLEYCKPYLPKDENDEYLKKIIILEQDRLKTFKGITELTDFFFSKNLVYDKTIFPWKKNTPEQTKIYLAEVAIELEKVSVWTKTDLEESLLPWIKDNNYGNGDILWPLRYALTAKKASPSPFEVASALGKDKTLERLKNAISMLS
ncbi:MAG: glutamate--tRNA ligase family protein, partial [bacterium]|nr:glutamate--tRNA ligase family protein [bacterium]